MASAFVDGGSLLTSPRVQTSLGTMPDAKLSRRESLQRLALFAGALLAKPRLLGLDAPVTGDSDKLGPLLPWRTLGRTGLKVTMLGVGGSHIGRPSEAVAQQLIETAIELGIRTFDTAQLYQNGGSEERYGRFLTPKYRSQVTILTKTMAQDPETARQHLEGSLRRLRTDYIDLWQLHDVRDVELADTRVPRVLEVMLKAKEQGKVRHIGFTGHASYRTHLHVLQLTDAFETCMMPMSIADAVYESFTGNVLPVLLERKMGVIAMKTLAADGLMGGRRGTGVKIIPELLSVEDALRYAWSLPVSTLISGMANLDHLRQNVSFARRFVPMPEADRNALIAKIAEIAQTGEMERGFKGQKGS